MGKTFRCFPRENQVILFRPTTLERAQEILWKSTLPSPWGHSPSLYVSLRPDRVSHSYIKLGNLAGLLAIRQVWQWNRKKENSNPLIIHILHYECSFLNLKNNLYNFCRKSNEHCLLIKPKGHGTCGFTFHLESVSAHRVPLHRVSAGEGWKPGL